MNLNEQTYRIKQMMGLLSEENLKGDTSECQKLVNKNLLEQAKKWWRDWLNNPSTKQRLKSKYNLPDTKIDSIIEKNLSTLEKITNFNYLISEFPSEFDGPLFSVEPDEDKKSIDVYCGSIVNKNISEKTIVGLLVHEIQHILDYTKELTSDSDIIKDFGIDLKSLGDLQRTKVSLDMSRVNKSYDLFLKEGFDSKLLDFYKQELIEIYKNGDPQYINEPSEIKSVISGIRNELNKTSGQNITLDDIKKSVTQDTNTNFYLMMLYALNSGKSMTELLNSVNSYAVTNTNNQPKTA